jgi:hypothetical protein
VGNASDQAARCLPAVALVAEGTGFASEDSRVGLPLSERTRTLVVSYSIETGARVVHTASCRVDAQTLWQQV